MPALSTPTLANMARYQAEAIAWAYHLTPSLIQGLSDVWIRALSDADRFRNTLCDASGTPMDTPNDWEAAAMAQSAGVLLRRIMILRGYVGEAMNERARGLHLIFYHTLRDPSSDPSSESEHEC